MGAEKRHGTVPASTDLSIQRPAPNFRPCKLKRSRNGPLWAPNLCTKPVSVPLRSVTSNNYPGPGCSSSFLPATARPPGVFPVCSEPGCGRVPAGAGRGPR